MVKRTVLAVLMVLSLCISVSAITQDNLVENGTFDTDMDSWTLLTSENMTITATGGNCEFRNENTDYYIDQNTTDFSNGTLYNITITENSIPGGSGNGTITLTGDTTTVNQNPYFNESLANWTYEDNISYAYPYIRGGYNVTNNVSPPTGYVIESIKKSTVSQSISFEDGTYQGIGSSKFIQNTTANRTECIWTGADTVQTKFARLYKEIFPDFHPINQSNGFWIINEYQSNDSAPRGINSNSLFGFMNSNNLTQSANSIIAGVNITGPLTIAPILYMFENNGTKHTGSNVIYTFTQANLTYGVRYELVVTSGVVDLKIYNKTSSHLLATSSILVVRTPEILVDCVGIGNNDWWQVTPSRSLGGYISNITIGIDGTGFNNYAEGKINQTFTLTNDSVVNVTIMEKHYRDAQLGIVVTVMRILNDTSSTLIYTHASTGSIAPEPWTKRYGEVLIDAGDVEIEIATAHSVVEGSTTWPAKAVWLDDCFVNVTTYRPNGTFYSDVKNSSYTSYEADWLDVSVFNWSYGTGYADYALYTRTGNTSTVDGMWSSWEQVTFTNFIDNSGLPWAELDEMQFEIESPNAYYLQYKVEMNTSKTSVENDIHKIVISSVENIPMTADWGVIEQNITKPYTNASVVNYKYKINYLNNTAGGNITVMMDSYLVAMHNFTWNTTTWIDEEHSLPNTFNASGTYTLNITVQTQFNTTNGTASILFDDVEFLIDTQAPTITSFTYAETPRASLVFNGTFTDYSRYDNSTFKGLSGIDNVHISVGSFDIDVTNITHLGNGSFEFSQEWENTPVGITNTTTMSALLEVTDTDGLKDSDTLEVILPRLMSYLLALVATGLIVMIIVIILQKHIVQDTKNDYLPEVITGKKKR